MNDGTKRKLEDLFADAEPVAAPEVKDVNEALAMPEKKRRRRAVRSAVVYVLNGKVVRNEEEQKKREETTVFVDNLPNDVDRKEIETFFKRCCATSKEKEAIAVRVRSQAFEHETGRGLFKEPKLNVLKGKLLKNHSCSAYIYFPTGPAYQKALEMDGALFVDRRLRVEGSSGGACPFEPDTSVFIGNLLLELQDDELHQFFIEKGISDVQKVRLIRDPRTRKGKGFGFVSFASGESVEKAMKLRGQYLRGRDLRIKKVYHRSAEKDRQLRDARAAQPVALYKDTQAQRKVERGAPKKQMSVRAAVGTTGSNPWEGQHADKKQLSRDLEDLTKQWKADPKQQISVSQKAKRKVEKERRDVRKEKKLTKKS
ncbi:Nucleolar protein 12 [Diplonema papillatum]|nr:Nucleolar protein 12 [Diplonema papillatum]